MTWSAGTWAGAPLASMTLGPVEFDQPVWLLLIPLLGGMTAWIGRSSLSGLGTPARRAALAVRLVVITGLAGAMAEPHWRREGKDVAVTVVLDASRSIPQSVQSSVDRWVETAAREHKRAEDRLGLVTAARDAYVQALPSRFVQGVDRQFIGAPEGTNLAAATSLAMAIRPEDAAYRLALVSDGNETEGSLLQAAQAAKAARVPIDVLPLSYRYDNEVVVRDVAVPATARLGETVGVRVVLESQASARGRLSILMNGVELDLDPAGAGSGMVVDLRPGTNALSVPVTLPRHGPMEFKAVFDPLPDERGQARDAIAENNQAAGVTFVSGEGRVLVVTEDTEAASPLLGALAAARIGADAVPAAGAPASLTEWNAYDAVVLVNQPAYSFSQEQQEQLRQYVHDNGGGLVMIGGPDSFGAGGWIGSPLEEALPIRLDPPQKREMPKGALALVIHSCEIPNGVYYGKKVCEAAAGALSRLDLIGINEYSMRRGTSAWVLPMQPVGDGAAVRRAINSLTFGDMSDFTPSLQLAFDALVNTDAAQRHVIVISDGDPSPPSNALLQRFVRARISITTVGIGTHGPQSVQAMQALSGVTGGRHYEVAQGQLGKLPQIFIKEAQTVRRSLIWEGTAFTPALVNAAAEPMRGITRVMPLSGYVVAAEREGLALVTLRGKENDPILAQWQHGLGKVVAYTSDASTRWNAAWVSWDQYRAFWEQHLRWAMRPGGSALIRVTPQNVGDETHVVVDALDPAGERLNFARFRARVARPDGTGIDLDLRMTGPGKYEGRFPSDLPGSYLVSMHYAAPGRDGGPAIEGSAHAAVTRPFADEFSDLQDNAALLKQVADLTGGRVLDEDPRRVDLWDRAGLEMPVTLRPVWLALALAGVGLFLVDVGVRRVRIDPAAVARAARAALSKARGRGGEQIGALRAAREQARREMAARGSGSVADAPSAGAPAASARALTPEEKAASRAKFEAAPGHAARGRDAAPVALGAEPGEKRSPGARREGAPAPVQPDEAGMSRLMKAKKRAREEMDEKDPGAG